MYALQPNSDARARRGWRRFSSRKQAKNSGSCCSCSYICKFPELQFCCSALARFYRDFVVLGPSEFLRRTRKKQATRNTCTLMAADRGQQPAASLMQAARQVAVWLWLLCGGSAVRRNTHWHRTDTGSLS
eukprot:COSAG01_NODE_942_length_12551_cov_47.129216_5_plen_130_part_00